MAKSVALYLRVSTAEQTVENQRRELEAVAARHGWKVVAAIEDAGISGAKGRTSGRATTGCAAGLPGASSTLSRLGR